MCMLFFLMQNWGWPPVLLGTEPQELGAAAAGEAVADLEKL